MQNILFMIKMPFIAFFGAIIIIGSIINGSIDINFGSNKLDVRVSNVKIDGEDITEYSVNKNMITFSTRNLREIGDESVLEYELINKSVYDVETSIRCTKNGLKSDYYTISDKTPNLIEAGGKSKATLTVTLVKESLTDSYENFYCELDIIAVQNH